MCVCVWVCVCPAGFLKSRPETALRKLSSLLNSSSSPLNVYAASRGRDGTRGASNAWSFNNVLNSECVAYTHATALRSHTYGCV